jgi:dephospho-CoA kinase
MSNDAYLKGRILSQFGERAYKQGELDRAYLAELVFDDVEKLSGLNALVHPAVREDYQAWLQKQGHANYVVEEAAILIESGASNLLDFIVLVYAPQDVRLQRVMERDHLSEAEVMLRMEQQMSEEEKKEYSDHVIVNDQEHMLLPQVIELHELLLQKVS